MVLKQDPVWMLRAKMRQEAKWQKRGASTTRYLWPSGRCYRVVGQDVNEASKAYLSCCVGLYANKREAALGVSMIGSAFFVEVPKDNLSQLYVVTSAGIIRDENIGDAPIMRVEHNNGKFQLISTRRTLWRVDEGGDLAVLALETRPLDFSYVPIPQQGFVTAEMMKQQGLVVGDNVFLPDRLSGPDDRRARTASLSFAEISRVPTLPSERDRPREDRGETISMKFLSTPGRPGSPVFLCTPPYHLHFGSLHNRVWSVGPKLLGVYTGPNVSPDEDHSRLPSPSGKVTQAPYGHVAEGGVVPIWKLLEMLSRDDTNTESDQQRDSERTHNHVPASALYTRAEVYPTL